MHYIQQNGQRFFDNDHIPVIEYRGRKRVNRKIHRPIFSVGKVNFRNGNYQVSDRFLARTVYLSNYGRASGVNPNKICVSFPETKQKKGKRIYVS